LIHAPAAHASLRAPTGPPFGHAILVRVEWHPGYFRAMRALDVPHPWTRQLF